MIESMMIVTLVIIIFLLLFINRSIKNFYLIFNIWWLFWITISKLNPIGLYEVTTRTYFYIFLGIISFNLSIFLPTIKIKQLKIKPYDGIDEKINKYIYLFCILYFFLNCYFLLKVLNYLNYSLVEYWKVRRYFFGIEGETYLFGRYLVGLVYNIAFLLNKSVFLYALVLFSYKEKQARLFLFLSFINLIVYSFISGGRKELLSLLIVIFIVIIYSKRRKVFLKPLLVIFILINIISYQRGFDEKMIESIVLYFSGTINFFDILLEKRIDTQYYYGGLLFDNLISIFYIIKSKIVGIAIETPYNIFGEKVSEYLVISNEGQLYNALTTIFYVFYKDLGILGISLYSLLLGYAYKIFFLSNTITRESIILFSYFDSLLILTIFNNPYNDLKAILPIVILLFFLKKSKGKKECIKTG